MHRAIHPEYVDGCYTCKLLTVSISAAATPSRKGSQYPNHVNATERRWAKDFAAIKQLKRDGIVPKSTDGVADLVARAQTRTEIETGKLLNDRQRIQLEHLTEKDIT